MIKNVKWIFVVLSISSLISFSFIEKNGASKGVMVGDKAPEFVLNSDGQRLDLSKFKGKHVLLNFWASYDADSRINNILFDHALQKTNKIKMVSVCFDKFNSVYEETIKKDQVDGNSNFIDLSGEASNIYKSYDLEHGFKNFLLDENGIIIAKNLQISEIASYLN